MVVQAQVDRLNEDEYCTSTVRTRQATMKEKIFANPTTPERQKRKQGERSERDSERERATSQQCETQWQSEL